jgi:hypothetical protein
MTIRGDGRAARCPFRKFYPALIRSLRQKHRISGADVLLLHIVALWANQEAALLDQRAGERDRGKGAVTLLLGVSAGLKPVYLAVMAGVIVVSGASNLSQIAKAALLPPNRAYGSFYSSTWVIWYRNTKEVPTRS